MKPTAQDTAFTAISDHAAALPGSFMTEQWMGSHVYKVGTPDSFKMFAILRPGKPTVCVKLESAEIAALLIEAEVAEAEPHLPRGGWANLHMDRMDLDEVCERVAESYETVAQGLPRSVRDML